MPHSLLKIVFKVRFLIYLAGAISLVVANFGCSVKRTGTEIGYEEMIAFWPPDLIPHPKIPGEEPSEPSTPTLA